MSYFCYHQHEPCKGGGGKGTCPECYKIMDEISCYGQSLDSYYKENGLCREYEESPESYAYHLLSLFDNNKKNALCHLENILFVLETFKEEKRKDHINYYERMQEELRKFPDYFGHKQINELNIRLQNSIEECKNKIT